MKLVGVNFVMFDMLREIRVVFGSVMLNTTVVSEEEEDSVDMIREVERKVRPWSGSPSLGQARLEPHALILHQERSLLRPKAISSALSLWPVL